LIINNNKIGYFFILVILLLPVLGQAQSDDGQLLTIADPYIELHTGPAMAYPIFHVIDRGEKISVLKRKTNWYQIRSAKAIEGWVNREQLQQTLLPNGQQLKLRDLTEEDFKARQWEIGVLAGELEDAPVISFYGAYAFTENISAEFNLGESVGTVSSSLLYKLNLLMQPFPDWEYSPFFTLGLGHIDVKPNATLINPPDKDNELSQIGIGFRKFLSKRFIVRAEYNEYVIFSASNAKDKNEDIGEWKLGFAVFF
jgi:hypothetical protein